MPDIEVVASAESNSEKKDVEVTPASAITDSNGQVMFTFRFPIRGGKLSFAAEGLSTTFDIGITTIRTGGTN